MYPGLEHESSSRAHSFGSNSLKSLGQQIPEKQWKSLKSMKILDNPCIQAWSTSLLVGPTALAIINSLKSLGQQIPEKNVKIMKTH